MFDPKTVLILGAGASVDHGFPLGVGLKEQVHNLAKAIAMHPTGYSPSPSIGLSRQHLRIVAEEFDRLERTGEFIGFSTKRSDHQKFADLLKSSLSSLTIDAFLRDHPSMADLGRFYIALELYSRTYRQDEQEGAPYVASAILTPNGNQGWYHKLVATLRDGCTTREELEESNRLNILTFNYDRSIELYLQHELGRTEKHSGADYRKVVTIQHLYGDLPEITFEDSSPIGLPLMQAATKNYNSIKILGQRATEEHLSRARSSIEGADFVRIIGFGFDPENCRQLGFPDSLQKSRIHLHNFDRESPNYRGIQHLFEDWQREAESVPEVFGYGPALTKFRNSRDLAINLNRRRIFYEPITHAITAGLFRTK